MTDADHDDPTHGDPTHGDPTHGDPTHDDPTLEERLTRLESILARMEAADVPLGEALALFEEGVGHVRAAEKVVAETELRVEELLANGETRDVSTDGE